MAREEEGEAVYSRIATLSAGQFADLLARSELPAYQIPGPQAPQAERAHQLVLAWNARGAPPAELAAIVDRVTGATGVATRAPHRANEPSRAGGHERPRGERARSALQLDRDEQWGQLQSRLGEPGDCAILVVGARDQGPELFVERIRCFCAADRRTLEVRWPRRSPPSTASDYLEALAATVDCRVSLLPRALRELATTEQLLLVHPVVPSSDDDPALVDYHTRALPELLAEAQSGGEPWRGVKVVQPITWQAAPILHQLFAWLLHAILAPRARWRRAAAEERSSRLLVARLVAAQLQDLPVFALPELRDFERRHVELLVRALRLDPARAEAIVDRAWGSGGGRPVVIHTALLQELS